MLGLHAFLLDQGRLSAVSIVSQLPRDENKDQTTIHHSAMDRAYAEIGYQEIFSGLEDSFVLGNMVIAGAYVENHPKLVPEDDKRGAQKRKSPINVNAVDRASKVSALGVQSIVDFTKPETDVQPASMKTISSPSNGWSSSKSRPLKRSTEWDLLRLAALLQSSVF